MAAGDVGRIAIWTGRERERRRGQREGREKQAPGQKGQTRYNVDISPSARNLYEKQHGQSKNGRIFHEWFGICRAVIFQFLPAPCCCLDTLQKAKNCTKYPNPTTKVVQPHWAHFTRE